VKTRLATYLSAGMLTIGAVCASPPAFADHGGVPGAPATTDDIPQVQTGRPVPIPHYWQPDGPWATPPQPVPAVRGPSLGSDFCVSSSPDLAAICLELKRLLHLLPFGA
jgi:hypothetical protein